MPNRATTLIEADRLAKHYATRKGTFAALDGCSLAVEEGQVFGLLGPNGAGKTTFLRLLLGFLAPTGGRASVAGHDCATEPLAVRSVTAYLPGEARLFRRMNGHAVLGFFSRLRPACRLEAARSVARRLDLDLDRQVARMSTGMRQKLSLAVTLAIDCRLVILDEPTANLDPTARGEVLELVREARAAGRTVVFSSHVLSEVESTCDRVAILRAGRVVHEQSVHEVRRRHRITARMAGFGDVPSSLASSLTVVRRWQDEVVLESGDSLTSVLGWLATLPLEEILVEPTGLSAIYDRFHRES
jgi:ABC-2 type transport system ATP-binding protein